jgi:colicin import membrane protein
MQIEQHWNVPAAAKDAHNLVVVIYLKLRQDGTVEIAKAQGGNKSHQFYDIAADSATRAVYKASPLQNLPKQKYKSWQEIELTFDPSNILY